MNFETEYVDDICGGYTIVIVFYCGVEVTRAVCRYGQTPYEAAHAAYNKYKRGIVND